MVNMKWKFKVKIRANKGSVLIMALWVVALLSFLSISLGRKATLEISLTKFMVGKVKSKYYAWAGIMQSLQEIKALVESARGKSEENPDSGENRLDQKYYQQLPHFQDVCPEGESCIFANFHIPELGQDGDALIAMKPEETKININGLTKQNMTVMIELLGLLGAEEENAQIISHSLLDWKDVDKVLSHREYGAEDFYYDSLSDPYNNKQTNFDTIYELLLVRGMTQEIFDELKPYVTVYPRQGRLAVNLYFAPEQVLKALALSMSGPITNTDREDAESMVKKVLDHRQSHSDEYQDLNVKIDVADYALNAKEKVLWLSLQRYRSQSVGYMHVYAWGRDKQQDITTLLETVINGADLSLVFWKRY